MNLRTATEYGKLFSKFSRPQNIFYSGLLAAFISYRFTHKLFGAIACYLVIFVLYAIAAGLNNIYDIKTDELNGRADNPLTVRSVSPQALLLFFALCLVALVVLQINLIQPATGLLSLGYILLAILYSYPKLNLKSSGWFSSILLCVCYGSIPLLVGLAQYNFKIEHDPLYYAGMQILFLFPVVLAKDYKDFVGDKLTHKLTPIVRYGVALVFRAAIICAVCTVLLYTATSTEPDLLMAALLSSAYVAMVYDLHRTEGKINTAQRLLLSMTILLMSVHAIA